MAIYHQLCIGITEQLSMGFPASLLSVPGLRVRTVTGKVGRGLDHENQPLVFYPRAGLGTPEMPRSSETALHGAGTGGPRAAGRTRRLVALLGSALERGAGILRTRPDRSCEFAGP